MQNWGSNRNNDVAGSHWPDVEPESGIRIDRHAGHIVIKWPIAVRVKLLLGGIQPALIWLNMIAAYGVKFSGETAILLIVIALVMRTGIALRSALEMPRLKTPECSQGGRPGIGPQSRRGLLKAFGLRGLSSMRKLPWIVWSV